MKIWKWECRHEIQKQKHWNWIIHNYRSPETSYKINDNTLGTGNTRKKNLVHYTILELKYDQTKKLYHRRKMLWKLVELLLLRSHYSITSLFSVGWLVVLLVSSGHEWWWILYVVNAHKHSLTMKWKSYALITCRLYSRTSCKISVWFGMGINRLI